LQRSAGGRSDRKSAPVVTAFHGYLEQLRHQCHRSLSAARTYTGIVGPPPWAPLNRFARKGCPETLRRLLSFERLHNIPAAPAPRRSPRHRPAPTAAAPASRTHPALDPRPAARKAPGVPPSGNSSLGLRLGFARASRRSLSRAGMPLSARRRRPCARVVPGVVDNTDEAEAAFARYAAAGMHVVRSTDPIEVWPGLAERASPREPEGDFVRTRG
jgi:hypothetical protein